MLDDSTRGQLATYFERISQPIELIASLDDSQGAADIRELVTEIAAIAPEQISARFDGSFARRPSFQITRRGQDMGVHFAALPMGHEFTSLLLALLWAGGHPPKVEAEVIEQIQALDGDFATARKTVYELDELITYLFEQGNPAGVKATMKHLGVCDDYVRLPLMPINDELRSKIAKKLKSMNLLG